MRKFISILTAGIILTAGLAACSSSDSDSSDPVVLSGGQTEVSGQGGSSDGEDQNVTPGEAGMFDFVYNGVVVTPGTSPFDVVDQLGDYSLFESESCAYQGTDRVYTYSSFIIRSSPDKNGNDVIVSIELKDDTVETTNGLYIGNSSSDVISACGDADTEMPGGLEYTSGSVTLSFIIADDAVTAINYTYINE